MRETKHHDGKDARITEDDLVITARSRVSLEGSSNVGRECMPEIGDLLQKLDRLGFGNFFAMRADTFANALRKLATMTNATIDFHDQQLIGGLQAVAYVILDAVRIEALLAKVAGKDHL